jgi:hypothetical protein
VLGPCLAALAAVVWASGAPGLSAQEADHAERAGPLALAVERHVAEAVARHDRADVPRFEVEVVKRWPQALLEEHLRGVDLECQPTPDGPPTLMEMRRHTGAGSIPVHADFLGPIKALARLFRSEGPPRYFLYQIRREDGLAYSLSEGRVSEAALATPGITWELVGSFADLKRGRAALRRLERGSARPEPEAGDNRLPPWVETTCRPAGFD